MVVIGLLTGEIWKCTSGGPHTEKLLASIRPLFLQDVSQKTLLCLRREEKNVTLMDKDVCERVILYVCTFK